MNRAVKILGCAVIVLVLLAVPVLFTLSILLNWNNFAQFIFFCFTLGDFVFTLGYVYSTLEEEDNNA